MTSTRGPAVAGADVPLLVGVELRRVAVPFRHPIGTSAATHSDRPILLVRVATDAGDGWGECAALADRSFADEDVDDAGNVLRDELIPVLLSAAAADGGRMPSVDALAGLVGERPGSHFAVAALEMAVLDAQLRVAGRSLAEVLGERHGDGALPIEVEAGATVGIPSAWPGDARRAEESFLADVERAEADGYRRVRLKIAPGWDIEPARIARTRFPDLILQVDANGAYRLGAQGRPEDAAHLCELDAFGLACVEQPLPAADLAGHGQLSRRMATPICLDESLTSEARLGQALRQGSCSVVCLKPSRLGGLIAAGRAHDRCREAGVPAWIGGMFESSLGRAANLAVASLPGCVLPGDLSPADRALGEDLVAPESRPAVRVAGAGAGVWVSVPIAPGVVPPPDPDVLARLSVATSWFPVGL